MKKEKNMKKREEKEHLFNVIYCWKRQSIDKKIIYQLAICPFALPLNQKKKVGCIKYLPNFRKYISSSDQFYLTFCDISFPISFFVPLFTLYFFFIYTMTTEPTFLIHQATHMFLTDPIHFQVTQMNNSLFVWIGKSDGKLGDMSIAVPPLGTQVKKKRD